MSSLWEGTACCAPQVLARGSDSHQTTSEEDLRAWLEGTPHVTLTTPTAVKMDGGLHLDSPLPHEAHGPTR